MTATNIVCQPRHRQINIVTDAAGYDVNTGIIVALGTKVFGVAHWPGVVTGRGTAIAIPVLGQKLSWTFPTFDDLIDGVEQALPKMVAEFAIRGTVELILAGWSRRHDEPRAYVIETTDEPPRGMTETEVSESKSFGGIIPDAYQLTRLPDATEGPRLKEGTILASNWEGLDPEVEPGEIVARLRKLIQHQRQEVHEGKHWIGGFVEHTVVTPDSISQRILYRWSDDAIGRPIRVETRKLELAQ
jgi:hypothetical protein